ncbi:hypothetical protein HYT74_02990 [Candidatus Daviesbacteria bacterium]|nr:hypothetical protein [Candidatus Daviesbacteria bacterium]MBI4038568.1 hypothetical protein [Candidatus Daviesbacteria bacterium]
MLNAKAFANAAAAVMAVWVLACTTLAYVAPDLLFSMAQSWTHAINLESVRATFTPNLGSLLLGLVSATLLTWVTTYGIITLYNKWAK